MIVVGENLKGLINAEGICKERSFDEFSIQIKLDNNIYRLKQEKLTGPIKYGVQEVDDLYELTQAQNGEVTISPGECILACSNEKIKMPLGYMGLVQTKGTLARMFVAAHCSDAQIEPGFEGKVTLELINHSPFEISIPVNSNIAQIYIFRCSTDNSPSYKGKYRNSDIPTLPLPL